MPNTVNLSFEVSKQHITRTDQEIVASGAINTLIANFTFCETWEGMYKFCRFEGAGGIIDAAISQDDTCVIPWEVIEAPSFTMACFGTLSDDIMLTTRKLEVKVYQSVNFIAQEAVPSTPALIEQYENIVQSASAAASAANSSAAMADQRMTEIVNEADALAEEIRATLSDFEAGTISVITNERVDEIWQHTTSQGGIPTGGMIPMTTDDIDGVMVGGEHE